MNNNKLYGKAFEYAVRGYSIIPIRRNKIPFIKSWKDYQKKAATEDQIESWWSLHPQANIGIITGKISGITVIDIDTAPPSEETTPLEAFPETYTVKTPTGGYHLYYQYDESIEQTANTFEQFPHVDIRNDGGYVIAPPSKCDYTKNKQRIAGTYKVVKNLPLAPFPTKLFHAKPQKDPNKRAKGVLEKFKGMEDGDGRNNALTKVTGRILRLLPANEREETGFQMALAANKQFKQPLPEREVKTIFKSILKREESKPLSEVEFLKTSKGDIISNEENVYRTLVHDEELQDHFRLNTFIGLPETNFGHEWDVIQRSDVIAVQMYLMRTYPHFMKVAHGAVEDAMMHYANENQVSPPVEWLESLTWDKKKRLDTWLTQVYGAEKSDYTKAVGANWMKGLVKRLVKPGCKFDYVLVLEGKQGIRKSTSLGILGGDWHVETVFAPDNKDFFMIFGGKAIVEFSEGETLSRTEAKRLKAVITMQYDKYRPPYERAAKEFPRQCVFAMTTNQDQYLKDETGNRRWLPVACTQEADVEWLKENREQLFAEAYHRVITKKEKTWEFPEEETLIQQEMRQTTDPKEELIYNWYFGKLTAHDREQGITTRDAFMCALQGFDDSKQVFGAKEMGKMEEMVISGILKERLHLDKRRSMTGGRRFYKYFPSPETAKIAPAIDTKIPVQTEW